MATCLKGWDKQFVTRMILCIPSYTPKHIHPCTPTHAATNLCFAEKSVYTQEVLAVVLQQLLEQTPIPMLFMRTVSCRVYS